MMLHCVNAERGPAKVGIVRNFVWDRQAQFAILFWDSAKLEDRRRVLKLTFATFLRYRHSEGFRTAQLSLPFKATAEIIHRKNEMARPERFEISTLCTDWLIFLSNSMS